MSEELPPPSLDQPAVWKDLTAGTIAGWAQVLVGQPFDIVKVRMQSSSLPLTPLTTASQILSKEGPLGFYKGTLMPLIGIGACVSLQFAFLQNGKRFLEGRHKGKQLTGGELFMAGAYAGLGNSVVSGPVEHIRIRLQTQVRTSTGALPYSGPLDVVRKIYATDGLRGIYQGQIATILRESYGYGWYFLTYEWLVQSSMEKNGWKRGEVPMVKAAAFGAVAGWAMWLLDYPLDVIKSRMQTDGLPSQPSQRKYPTVLSCIRQLYSEGGVSAFTRGLTPTLIRSPFVNATTFVVFEMTMRALA